MYSPKRIFICLISVLVLPLLLVNITSAGVYDDFSGENIDTTKWTIRSTPNGRPGFFTQSNGRLHFVSEADAGESLVSTMSFAAGFFRIEFYDFHSSNNSPPAKGKGSFVALGLGPRDNYVRMLRGAVSTGGYFEANQFANSRLQLWYVPTEVSSGQLALLYDGSRVSFFWNNGLELDKGWQKVGPRVTPGWHSSPALFISGYPGASGRTTFAVDNLEYVSVPAIPPFLLKRLER